MSGNIALYGLAGLNMALCVLSHTALWQRKEYRMDRMRAYIYSPEKSIIDIGIWSIALLLSVSAFVISWTAYASMLILLAGYILRGMKRGVFRPKFTARAILVSMLSAALLMVATFTVQHTALISLIAISSPFFVAFAVSCTALVSVIKKGSIIMRAIRFRKTLSSLQVIGITGSVGKTSAKTYALHILKENAGEVVATKKHRNSPFPVALDMLSQVTEQTAIYIAELAAYKKGEIAELCEIVQPNIGVITAITNQHAALFGSVEKLAQAKWELAQALPQQGTLILNKDDTNIQKLALNFAGNIVWYSMNEPADIAFTNIELQKESVSCVLVIKDERYKIVLPVVGRGQLSSALAACAIAYVAGMPQDDIVKKLESLPEIEKTMQKRTSTVNSLVVDDSYSASEASVMNAIDYLNTVGDEHSLLVLVPIIELGEEAAAVHARIGAALAHVKFQTLIYSTAYQDDMMRGLAGTSHPHVAWYVDAKMLADDVIKQVSEKHIVLFEGRLPGIVTTL